METSYPIVLTSTKEGYTAYIPDFNLTAKIALAIFDIYSQNRKAIVFQ